MEVTLKRVNAVLRMECQLDLFLLFGVDTDLAAWRDLQEKLLEVLQLCVCVEGYIDLLLGQVHYRHEPGGFLTNLGDTEIDILVLKQAGAVPHAALAAKVILNGEIKRKIILRGLLATKGARAAIEKAGGSVEG